MSTRYISQFAKPTPYQRELVTIFIEEAAEVQQRATKLLRFGAEEKQKDQPWTNAERLAEEYGQLLAMADLISVYGFLPIDSVHRGRNNKLASLAKFMQEEPGVDD